MDRVDILEEGGVRGSWSHTIQLTDQGEMYETAGRLTMMFEVGT